MKRLLPIGSRVRFTRKEDRQRYGDTGIIVDEFKTRTIMLGIRPDAEPQTVADTNWMRIEATTAFTCVCRRVYPAGRPLYCECGADHTGA